MTKFKIVTNGELALGYRPDEVRRNLKELCKYDTATLAQVFSGFPFTFKAGLDETTAGRYKAALDRAGIVCEIDDDLPEIKIEMDSVDAFAVSHHPPVVHVEKMTCPKCGERQIKTETCAACGVLVEKFRQQQLAKQFTPPPDTEALPEEEEVESSGSKLRVLGWLLLVVFLAMVGFGLYRVFFA